MNLKTRIGVTVSAAAFAVLASMGAAVEDDRLSQAVDAAGSP